MIFFGEDRKLSCSLRGVPKLLHTTVGLTLKYPIEMVKVNRDIGESSMLKLQMFLIDCETNLFLKALSVIEPKVDLVAACLEG